jgi:hypothetical protein
VALKGYQKLGRKSRKGHFREKLQMKLVSKLLNNVPKAENFLSIIANHFNKNS